MLLGGQLEEASHRGPDSKSSAHTDAKPKQYRRSAMLLMLLTTSQPASQPPLYRCGVLWQHGLCPQRNPWRTAAPAPGHCTTPGA